MTVTFGATSTADEVLAGVGLHGRRVLVTGASAGIGEELARVLVARGASVVGTTRDVAGARAAIAAAGAQSAVDGAFELVELDLASLASVRSCAGKLVADGRPFDLVIANAGVMAGPKRATADGFEMQFGANHLGHFVLVNRIAALMPASGRVVMVSSAGHRRANVDLEDPNFERTPYAELTAYGRSKTANVLFAVAFDRRHAAAGVRATAVHPGAIMTGTVRTMVDALGDGRDAAVAAFDWKTPSQGAATSLWAGLVASADDVAARYCEDCRVAEVVDDPASRAGVRSYALDGANAEALWATSEALVGERF